MKKPSHAFESCLSIASHEVVWEKMKVSSVTKIPGENTKDQSTRRVSSQASSKILFQKAKITSGDQSVPTLILQVILEEN